MATENKQYKQKAAELHAANLRLLKERLKSREVSGSYVFYGDEDYTKNYYYDELCAFCENKALNIKTISGNEFDIVDFINACDTTAAVSVDMFSLEEENQTNTPYRLIRLVSPKLDDLNKKEMTELMSRIEDTDEGVIIVLWLNPGEHEAISRGVYKKIAEASLTVNFKQESPGSPTLIAWILRHFNKAKIDVQRNVAAFMSNYVGCDMTTLKNEIDNCINYLKYENRTSLTKQDIEFVCTKSLSALIFDIKDGALEGDYTKAMTTLVNIMNTSKSTYKTIPAIFASIFKAVSDLCDIDRLSKQGDSAAIIAKKIKMHEYPVKKYLGVLRNRANTNSAGKESYSEYASRICLECEEKRKTSGLDDYALLRDLVFKLSVPKTN